MTDVGEVTGKIRTTLAPAGCAQGKAASRAGRDDGSGAKEKASPQPISRACQDPVSRGMLRRAKAALSRRTFLRQHDAVAHGQQAGVDARVIAYLGVKRS